MKRITSLFIVLLVAGCATITNPVNSGRLYIAKATYGTALAQAVAYRRLCVAHQLGSLQAGCGNVVRKLQAYDRSAQSALKAASTFAANNPNLDASSFVTLAEAAVSAFQAAANNPGAAQ